MGVRWWLLGGCPVLRAFRWVSISPTEPWSCGAWRGRREGKRLLQWNFSGIQPSSREGTAEWMSPSPPPDPHTQPRLYFFRQKPELSPGEFWSPCLQAGWLWPQVCDSLHRQIGRHTDKAQATVPAREGLLPRPGPWPLSMPGAVCRPLERGDPCDHSVPWPQACLGESPHGQQQDMGGAPPSCPLQARPSAASKIAILWMPQAPGSMASKSSQAPGCPGRRVEKGAILRCTPGRPGCGPADGEVRATPALMSAPTCFFLAGLALWALFPCGPGSGPAAHLLEAAGGGRVQLPSFPMHGLGVRLSLSWVSHPYLVEALQKQDGVVPWWWGPKADVGELDAASPLLAETAPGTAGLVFPG